MDTTACARSSGAGSRTSREVYERQSVTTRSNSSFTPSLSTAAPPFVPFLEMPSIINILEQLRVSIVEVEHPSVFGFPPINLKECLVPFNLKKWNYAAIHAVRNSEYTNGQVVTMKDIVAKNVKCCTGRVDTK